MNKIKQFLDSASAAYYAGSPIISDAQFDALAESADYNSVGAKQHTNVAKHFKQMYSLQKFYEDEGQNRPLEGIKDVTASIKLDGAATSHLYIDKQYVMSLTRGDGVEGQIITALMLATDHIPKTIDIPGVVQITGEFAAPSHVENARNYAAGALGLKDPNEFKTRAVTFFAYGVYPYQCETFSEDMSLLERNGFRTIYEEGIDKIYPCDGIVFRVNNNTLFESMGYTSKHPKGAYAKKVRSAHVETTLLGVEWQVGKSGKVTPVAILEPVLIGDALVSRATLNNPGFIEMLDLRIGDRVAVIRAGEIIPCILHKVDA